MSEVYPMIPAASKALWLLAAVGVLMLALAGLLGAAAWAASHTQVVVSPDGVRVEGDPFFSRDLAWRELDVEGAGIVSLAGDSAYRLKWRTLGTGLPGYGAGWFELGSGEKALAFVTRGERAVRVPTRAGWSLLVTVEHPERLLERLRSSAGSD